MNIIPVSTVKDIEVIFRRINIAVTFFKNYELVLIYIDTPGLLTKIPI